MNGSPFHAGELRAQALAGGGAGGAGIRPFMPEQHRVFFASLPIIFLGLTGEDGWPLATLVTGQAGFISSPDPSRLRVEAKLPETDPGERLLRPGAPLGLLGLEFGTRRRNRVNGIIAAVDADGWTLEVQQSFGNCAKYIQTREIRAVPTEPAPAEHLDGLDEEAVSLIRSADTFFVASGAADRDHSGMDVSHRGGRPGFVRVVGSRLMVPDFHGNHFFNTLGNLLEDPRASLLFIDFETGDLLHLWGVVSIDWHPSEGPPGTERLWRFDTEAVRRRRNALPLRFVFSEFSPASLATGTW